MAINSIKFGPSKQLIFSCEMPPSVIPTLITGIALTAIATLTVGILAYMQLVNGLNAFSQYALIAAGSFGVVTTFAVGLLYKVYKTQTVFLPREDAYAQVRKVFLEQTYKKENPQQLTTDISSLKPHELHEILEAYFQKVIKENKNPIREIEDISKILPLEALENVIRTQFSLRGNALSWVQEIKGEAENYLEIRKSATPTLHARWLSLLDTLISILDNILYAFGVADFFKTPDGSTLQGDFKFQKIMMLVTFFTLLTGTLLPMFGVTTSASIVGGILFLIGTLSVIWPRVRPLVTHLPHAENRTREVQMKQLWAHEVRPKEVHQVATLLEEGNYPLIIGPSGIGKTQTVIELVQAIEAGKYPKLKGKTVFYFNTADFVGNYDWFTGGNDILKRINDTIGERNRENCILVFDEIHLLYQGKDHTPIGEQLKTFLDEKPKNYFPYVIGLTTDEEYTSNIFVSNPAADRRYVTVEITKTDIKDTQDILNHYMVQNAPDVFVDDSVIKYLVESTQHLPQPITAKRILKQCITQARAHNSQKTVEAKQLESQIKAEYTRRGVSGNKRKDCDKERLETMKRKLTTLQEEAKKEKELVEKLKLIKKHFVDATRENYEKALKINKKASKNLSQTDACNFLLLNHIILDALEKEILDQSASLGVKSMIDKPMIDKILCKEEEHQKKRQEAIERSKHQVKERNSPAK